MKNMKVNNKLLLWGALNIISPFPVYVLTAFWSLLVMILFQFDDSSVVATIISMLPMLPCPVSCILSIIYGVKHWSMYRKNSIMCMTLSTVGLVGFVLLVLIMAHLSAII